MKNRNYLKKLENMIQDVLGNREPSAFDSLLDKLGDFKTEKGTNDHGDWVKTTYTSNDGTYTQVSYILHGKLEKQDTNDEIDDLKIKLQKCVEKQDYENAAIMRDRIKNFEDNKLKVEDLKKELDIVIKEHNFERAIEIREELKNYTNDGDN
jgi:protein-arginine kinase activator protein McsA